MAEIKFKSIFKRKIASVVINEQITGFSTSATNEFDKPRDFSKNKNLASIGPFVELEEKTYTVYITAHFKEYVKFSDIVVDAPEIKESVISISIKNNVEPTQPPPTNQNRYQFELVLVFDTDSIEKIKKVNEPIFHVLIDFNENQPKRATRIIPT